MKITEQLKKNMVAEEDLFIDIQRRFAALCDELGFKGITIDPENAQKKTANFNPMNLMSKLGEVSKYFGYLPDVMQLFGLCVSYFALTRSTAQLMTMYIISQEREEQKALAVLKGVDNATG